MSDAQLYMLARQEDEAETIALGVATRIESGEQKLTDVILSIQENIADDDLTIRAKCIGYMAAVIRSLKPGTLTRQHIDVLVQFLRSRIDDGAGVKEAAIGLKALSLMTRFRSTEAAQIADTLFANAEDLQRQPVSSRLQVYSLVDSLLSEHRAALLKTGDEFIEGFTTLAAMEKDPRNLMIVFSILQVIIVEWDISGRVDQLWEAAIKYFPITFRTKPDDPIGITADDLKHRLRNCIAASGHFAPLAFPLLIQKLDDQATPNVRKDVLQTIGECAKNYDPVIIATWCTQIWDALKYEVTNSSDDDLAKEALNALAAIAARLSYGLTLDTSGDTALHRYVTMIAKECKGHLQEPQHRFAKQSSQIIEAIAAASPCSFRLLTIDIVPPILTLYQDFNGITQKKSLLEVFSRIFDAAASLVGRNARDASVVVTSPTNGGFAVFKDSLFEDFSSALMSTTRQEVSFRIVALQGLLKLVKIPGYLNPSEVSMIVQYLDEIVLVEERGNGEIQEEAILALQEISISHYQLIADVTFPAFMAKLPDAIADKNDIKQHAVTLEGLAKISTAPQIFSLFTRRLLSKFDAVLQNGSTPDYAYAIVTALHYGLVRRDQLRQRDSGKVSVNPDLRVLVEDLYRRVVELKTYPESSTLFGSPYVGVRSIEHNGTTTFLEDKLLDLVGRIATLVLRTDAASDQTWAATELYTLFVTKTDSVKDEKRENKVLNDQYDLSEAPKDQKSTIILTMHILAGLKSDQKLLLNYDIYGITAPLIYGAHGSMADSPYTRAALYESIGILVNKFNATSPSERGGSEPAVQLPQEIIKSMLHNIYIVQPEGKLDEAEVKTILRAALAFTRGALLKNDRITTEFLNLLVDGLAVPQISSAVATVIANLLEPSEILCKENFAIIRLLHKQRVFDTCVASIIENFRGCSNAQCKPNYLIALAGILKNTPSSIVLSQIETLLPLLLQSIDVPGAGVRSASIETLTVTISENPTAVESHINSVIARLVTQIRNTKEHPSTNPPSVRIKALKCLGELPKNLRESVTLPFKADVVRELWQALGDSKREVRAEAVDCRNIWLNVAEPAAED